MAHHLQTLVLCRTQTMQMLIRPLRVPADPPSTTIPSLSRDPAGVRAAGVGRLPEPRVLLGPGLAAVLVSRSPQGPGALRAVGRHCSRHISAGMLLAWSAWPCLCRLLRLPCKLYVCNDVMRHQAAVSSTFWP